MHWRRVLFVGAPYSSCHNPSLYSHADTALTLLHPNLSAALGAPDGQGPEGWELCPPRLSVLRIGDVGPERHGEECQDVLVRVKCCAGDR